MPQTIQFQDFFALPATLWKPKLLKLAIENANIFAVRQSLGPGKHAFLEKLVLYLRNNISVNNPDWTLAALQCEAIRICVRERDNTEPVITSQCFDDILKVAEAFRDAADVKKSSKSESDFYHQERAIRCLTNAMYNNALAVEIFTQRRVDGPIRLLGIIAQAQSLSAYSCVSFYAVRLVYMLVGYTPEVKESFHKGSLYHVLITALTDCLRGDDSDDLNGHLVAAISPSKELDESKASPGRHSMLASMLPTTARPNSCRSSRSDSNSRGEGNSFRSARSEAGRGGYFGASSDSDLASFPSGEFRYELFVEICKVLYAADPFIGLAAVLVTEAKETARGSDAAGFTSSSVLKTTTPPLSARAEAKFDDRRRSDGGGGGCEGSSKSSKGGDDKGGGEEMVSLLSFLRSRRHSGTNTVSGAGGSRRDSGNDIELDIDLARLMSDDNIIASLNASDIPKLYGMLDHVICETIQCLNNSDQIISCKRHVMQLALHAVAEDSRAASLGDKIAIRGATVSLMDYLEYCLDQCSYTNATIAEDSSVSPSVQPKLKESDSVTAMLSPVLGVCVAIAAQSDLARKKMKLAVFPRVPSSLARMSSEARRASSVPRGGGSGGGDTHTTAATSSASFASGAHSFRRAFTSRRAAAAPDGHVDAKAVEPMLAGRLVRGGSGNGGHGMINRDTSSLSNTRDITRVRENTLDHLAPLDAPSNTLRGKIVARMTSLDTNLKRLASELMFELSDRNDEEFIRHTGLGNAVAYLQSKKGMFLDRLA